MEGKYIGNYKIYDFNKETVYYELVTLNKLGISYSVVYGEENELEITIKYNINTLVNLNNCVLNFVSFGKPKFGLCYYSSQDFYWMMRPCFSIIFDLFEYILSNYKFK